MLLECCYITMGSSQWENWNHLFCRKVSFLTAPSCQFRGVAQGMKQIFIPAANCTGGICTQHKITVWNLRAFLYLFELSNFILYNKVWKDNWKYWEKLISIIIKLRKGYFPELVLNNNTNAQVWLLTNIENIYIPFKKAMNKQYI
jgi:hypothetical protein